MRWSGRGLRVAWLALAGWGALSLPIPSVFSWPWARCGACLAEPSPPSGVVAEAPVAEARAPEAAAAQSPSAETLSAESPSGESLSGESLSGESPTAATPSAGAGEAPVSTGTEVPRSAPPSAGGRLETAPSLRPDWTTAVKLTLGAVSVGVLGVALVLVYRKWLPGASRSTGAGGLQVVGRAALSPRHLVYLLRLGDKRIVVGVSGDRMTSLAVLDEPLPKRLPAQGPPSIQVSDRGQPPPSRPVTEADLLPYRRQVSRLRDLLRGAGGGDPSGQGGVP